MDEKLFYTIGEVSKYVDVKPYVLRYWETEFRKLNPQKSVTGQRTYRKKDIQMALTIRRLLYEEKYTIAGAIQKLEELENEGLDSFIPPVDETRQVEEAGSEAAGVSVEEKTIPGEAEKAGITLEEAKGEAVKPRGSARPPEKIRELFTLIAETKSILEKYPAL